MIGTVVEKDEVKARWGYCDLFSTRFAQGLSAHNLSANLRAKVSNGDPFSALDASERSELVAMAVAGPRSGLVALLDDTETYRCAGLTKGELAQVWAIPAFDPNGKQHLIPYLAFLAGARPANEPHDPRRAADAVPTTDPFEQTEPGVIGLVSTVPVLLDGYCRSVLFMRSENVHELYLAWMPAKVRPK